nr:RING finger protein like [Ipomoea batatas]
MAPERPRVMTGRRVLKSLQGVAAHGLLFSFTLLLVLKLDRAFPYSWWAVFTPLWLFHVVVARGRFSLPAPSMPHGRNWAPYHAIMATPLLVAFELLLCIYLDSRYAVNLKIVFFPLLMFESAILVDNVRMCRALMPGDDENLTDEAIWETLPHFWVAISMVFLIAATAFTLLKLCGDVVALGWWDLFINYGVAQCFAFLICTKWYNPAIHRHSHIRTPSSSSTSAGYSNRGSGLLVSPDEEFEQSGICSLQDIGGHIMKVLLVGFQIMLFMRLAETPPSARYIPIPVLFAPLFLLQGVAVVFALFRFLEKITSLLYTEGGNRNYFRVPPIIHGSLGFMHRGSRLLGWWSIDEGSREEQARLYQAQTPGYNTFSPDIVKKMPKSDLVEEIWRLQAALSEQTEASEINQEEFEKLQNEKVLCKICFEKQINVVLLPCRHHILCSTCCEKCKRCPICRVYIEERLPVYDV